MKKFFQPTTLSVGDLSLEEQAILLNEIGDGDATIQATINNLNRVEDTGQALEDVLVIAEVTPKDELDANASLVRSIGEMAVVGTDADPTAIFPNPVLTVESLSDAKSYLKKIWESILEMLRQLRDQIKASFNKYAMFLDSHKQRFVALRDQAKKIDPRQYNAEQTVPLGLCVRNGRAPRNADGILDNWDVVHSNTEKVLVGHADNDAAVAKVIVDLLKNSTSTLKRTEEPSLVTRDFSKHIAQFVLDMTTMTKTHNEFTRPKRDDHHISVALTPDLPGGVQLMMKMREEQVVSKFTSVQRLNAYLASFVELEQHASDGKLSVEVKLPRPDMLIKILDLAIDTLDIALGYLNSGQNKLQSAQKQIEAATNQLVEAIDSVEVPQAAQAYVQTFLRFNKHYATTTTATANAMLRVVRQQLTALEAFTKKCLTHYLHMV